MPAHVPPSPDELTFLLAVLDQERTGVRLAAFGLDDRQAGLTTSASALSVGGVIKHLARVERTWAGIVECRHQTSSLEAHLEGFRFGPDDVLAEVLADYAAAAAETDAVLSAVTDPNQPVPVPRGVPWFPSDVEAWTVRWVVLHLIAETSRHAGHADIVREGIDGATAMSLMAAAEGWEPTPWLEPWRPESDVVSI